MKTLLLLLMALLLIGCTDSKDLTSISKGMNKDEVVETIGEPSRKTDIEVAELWTYPEYNKTLVLRADTVYDIVTTATIKVDSIEQSLKEFGGEIKEGARKVGRGLDTLGDKLEDRFDRDTVENR